MFESLSEKLDGVFRGFKSRGKLTEKNVEEGLKEVRMALLEADVHYRVVKTFIAEVKKRALGRSVLESLTPGQQIIKIVNEELTALMGDRHEGLSLTGVQPAAVMLIGLQGSGKTTTAGKLAVHLRKNGKTPYLVPVDVYRPAAIEQLTKLGESLSIPVYPTDAKTDPVEICKSARSAAHEAGCDVMIIDTAGRLHIDDELMAELTRIRQAVQPSDMLLVADAMTGQDAVNIAKSFNDALSIDGVVLTKMDGDARGGAALSIKAITDKPICFIGVGEKLSALEPFHPDRMANSILGMGDVLTFIEKAQSAIDEEKAAALEKKIRKSEFTLEDFRDQLVQIRKMGPIKDLIGMVPGFAKMKQFKQMDVDEGEFVRIEAMINSMTPEERRRHSIINGSRRKRIARGSGTSVQDVNRMLKNYGQMLKVLKKINKGGKSGIGRNMLPF